MSVYLHDIPLDEALDRFWKALHTAGMAGVLDEESIPLDLKAVGRVLSQPVWARVSSPHYHAAAMDGYAVRAEETRGARLTAPMSLACGDKSRYVDTGDLLPESFDAVIPIENVEALTPDGEIAEDPRNPAAIRIREAVVPWQHVRPLGEDMIATQLVLPAGQVIRPVDLGALAGSGQTAVIVSTRPKVAVIPTGTELVEIGSDAQPGEILEYNSLMLAAQVQEWGGLPHQMPIQADEFEIIRKTVKAVAKEHDLVLLNAGSSAGAEDFSARVVESLGTLLVHGVAVRPGHPVILGLLDVNGNRKVPIIGVPGYPVSAAITGELFVEPLLARWLGRTAREPEIIEAELTRKVTSPGGDDDFQRVVVGQVGERILAAPLPRGAGVISSLVRADGLALIPRGSQGESAGATIKVRLYRSKAEISRTIMSIGSHDLTLDLIAQFLSQYQRRLTSANAGSLGGLMALRRGEAHLAGSHLLDPDTGAYNLRYISQYLPGVPVRLIGLVMRQQGLMVPAGNPKGIQDLRDLARPDVGIINRQRGAGTRVLLDYQLDQLGIDRAAIHGYAHEEFSHLMVAASIASGRADCGMGIAAAADALGLDFIPLYEERYDLVVPEEHIHSNLLRPLWELLDRDDFQAAVSRLPGYNTRVMNKTMATVS
jgi:putative molybdopterin biosynthesis protein